MAFDLAATLAEAGIKLRSHGPGEHRSLCPRCAAVRHRAGDDALAVKVDERGAAWCCHRCSWSGAVSNQSIIDRPRHRSVAPPPKAAEAVPQRWSDRADRMWSAGLPITGSPVERYLDARGCALPPAGEEVIRFLSDALHWPTRTRWPAMMALITDAVTAEKMSLHLTFLRPDGSGKAAVDRPKLLLQGHQKSGGCIRLTNDADVTLGLGLAEGIETALAVVASGWSPVWAAIDAGNLRAFPILAGIEALSLFADADPAGLAAVETAAERWRSAGREAAILPAPEMAEAA